MLEVKLWVNFLLFFVFYSTEHRSDTSDQMYTWKAAEHIDVFIWTIDDMVMSVFQMTVWWQALVLCCLLNCVESSAPSPLLLRNKYHNSFRLTRSTRTRVQQLQKKYVSTDNFSLLQLIIELCAHWVLAFPDHKSLLEKKKKAEKTHTLQTTVFSQVLKLYM